MVTLEESQGIIISLSLSLSPTNFPPSGLENAGLPDWKENFVDFDSDGAMVMIRRKNVVTAQLKAEIPYLLDIHCLAHEFELGALDALKAEPQFNDVKEVTTITPPKHGEISRTLQSQWVKKSWNLSIWGGAHAGFLIFKERSLL